MDVDNLTVRASVYHARLQSRRRLYIALVAFPLTCFGGALSLIFPQIHTHTQNVKVYYRSFTDGHMFRSNASNVYDNVTANCIPV